MNRWHRRLAELRDEVRGPPCALPPDVQNVQNVQNPAPASFFEHSEQFEQQPESAAAPAEAPPPWSDLEEERAAIVEYEAGIPRAWAEGFARLHPDRPPADVPAKRWQQFVDDCGRFLNDGFAKTAAALGWGPFDLFGADRDRPFARIGQAGLLWLLGGDRLIALSESTAIIETRCGKRHTYHRKPAAPDRVLAWKLAP